MPEPVIRSQWEDDMRLLKAAYSRVQSEGRAKLSELADDTGLDKDYAFYVLSQLERDGYLANVSTTQGHNATLWKNCSTEKGLRQVGAWPDADRLPEQIADALAKLAESETDETKASKILGLAKAAASETGKAAIREIMRSLVGG